MIRLDEENTIVGRGVTLYTNHLRNLPPHHLAPYQGHEGAHKGKGAYARTKGMYLNRPQIYLVSLTLRSLCTFLMGIPEATNFVAIGLHGNSRRFPRNPVILFRKERGANKYKLSSDQSNIVYLQLNTLDPHPPPRNVPGRCILTCATLSMTWVHYGKSHQISPAQNMFIFHH